MDPQLGSIVWMTVCAALVMLMQGGFCLLESGLCRAKHSINAVSYTHLTLPTICSV